MAKTFFIHSLEIYPQSNLMKKAILLILSLAIVSISFAQNAKDYDLNSRKRALQGDFMGAKADITKAIEMDPNNASYYFIRADYNHSLNDYKATMLDISKAIELKPSGLGQYLQRGKYYHETEQYELALADFSKEIQLDPKSAETFFWRAMTKSNLDDQAGAIEDYTKAIDFAGTSSAYDAYLKRGQAKFYSEDFEGAIIDFDYVIKGNSKHATEAYFSRGMCKAQMEDFESAIEDLTEVLKRDPENAQSYLYRGYLRLNVGSNLDACKDFTKANQLGNSEAGDAIKNYCN